MPPALKAFNLLYEQIITCPIVHDTAEPTSIFNLICCVPAEDENVTFLYLHYQVI